MKTRFHISTTLSLLAAVVALAVAGCGDDGNNAAIDRGVGDACSTAADCPKQPEDPQLECLPFKGGYCGLEGCDHDADCPTGSACIDLEGTNYCFLVCVEKVDCNVNRPPDAESNCVASVDFVDGAQGRKACEPPSGT